MNGRRAKARRRAEREHSEQQLAAIRAAVPVRLRTTEDGQHEVFQRGPATFVVPIVPADAPAVVREAVSVHRVARLTLDCPRCPSEAKVTEAGLVYVRHRAGCVGDTEVLVRLAEEHGVAVQR
ncbi:hypothetical protein [Streptomyces sp. C1-2]|uniref:hypothetical protein n=1 Tax=Streptomyces sp. C1-2 TaxID=2720022 RepID=UPI0014324073|nr:hypothetical protein [Streptomyces sp. C1-2]NJP72171.1 hypothetical protein [Streptomyces sp. C1-2]